MSATTRHDALFILQSHANRAYGQIDHPHNTRGGAMPGRIWFLLAVLVLGFADVSRGDTLKSKFRCPELPDSQVTLSVKIDDATQATTLKWKGKNLGANASVNCGYDCFVLGSTRFSFCSAADAAGKWKYVDENPTPGVCIGMFPRITLLPANTPCYLLINP